MSLERPSPNNGPDDKNRVVVFLICLGVLVLGASGILWQNSPGGMKGGGAGGAGEQVADQPTNPAPVGLPDPPAPVQDPVPVPSPAPIRQFAAQSFWVNTPLLKVRTAPGRTSDEMPGLELLMGREVVGNAEAVVETTSGPSTWVRVNTGDGIGWVNKRYLSESPVAPPPPPPAAARAPAIADYSVPGLGSHVEGLQTGQRWAASGYYVQAGAAPDETQMASLRRRFGLAQDCIGPAPQIYVSDSFTKTRRRNMVLLAYGPYEFEADAEAVRGQLIGCIHDAFVNHQP